MAGEVPEVMCVAFPCTAKYTEKEWWHMTKQDVLNMSNAERLQCMEILWDSLIDDQAAVESPDWHGSVLAERKKKIENGQASFLTLDELRNAKRS